MPKNRKVCGCCNASVYKVSKRTHRWESRRFTRCNWIPSFCIEKMESARQARAWRKSYLRSVDGQSTRRISLRRSHRGNWWWRTIRRGKKPRKRVNFYTREMKFLSRCWFYRGGYREIYSNWVGSNFFSSASFFRGRQVVMQSRRIERWDSIDHLLCSTIISRIKGTRVRGSECRTSVRQVDYPESRSARRSTLFIVTRFKFAVPIYFFFLSFFLFFSSSISLNPVNNYWRIIIIRINMSIVIKKLLKTILKLSFREFYPTRLNLVYSTFDLCNDRKYSIDRKYCTLKNC